MLGLSGLHPRWLQRLLTYRAAIRRARRTPRPIRWSGSIAALTETEWLTTSISSSPTRSPSGWLDSTGPAYATRLRRAWCVDERPLAVFLSIVIEPERFLIALTDDPDHTTFLTVSELNRCRHPSTARRFARSVASRCLAPRIGHLRKVDEPKFTILCHRIGIDLSEKPLFDEGLEVRWIRSDIPSLVELHRARVLFASKN